MAGSGSARLGVGIIGAGPVTQAIHLRTLARLSDVFDVVAVMDVDAGVAAAVASRAGAVGLTDADALINDPRVDVVAICSPPQFHAAQVRAAIAAGRRAVLCEKPFAVNGEEAAAIAAEARASRTPIVVGAVHTFDPVWREALAAVQDAGAVHTVRSTIVLPFNDRFEDWATQIHQRRTPPPADGTDPALQDATMRGAVLGLAVHNLPHVRQLVGAVEAVTHAGLLSPFGYQLAVTGIGQICFSPIEQGLLTGKYQPGTATPSGTRATDAEGGQYIEGLLTEDLLTRVQALRPLAAAEGLTMAQLAVAWVLQNDNVASAITGGSRAEQVLENAAAAGKTLSPDTLEGIDAALGDAVQRDASLVGSMSPADRPS